MRTSPGLVKSVSIVSCAIGALLSVLPTGAVKANEVGLALVSVASGDFDDPTDCPSGLALNPKEIYFQSLPPAKREEFQKRDKEAGAEAAYITRILSNRRTTDGRDACEAPTEYKDPPMRVSQSKVSFGMNLDGGDTTTHCGHQKFVSADGQVTGIDNQVARLTACMLSKRKNLGRPQAARGALTLIRISDVQDVKNDDSVTVDLYRSANKLMKDGSGKPLPDVTLIADENGQVFHATAHGKIVDGVLLTEPVDMLIRGDGITGDNILRGARLQLKLDSEGGAEGLLAGYETVDSLWDSMSRSSSQQQDMGYSCPAFYEALHKLADGYKDPKTGQCTAISTAYRVKAIRAFVIPPKTGPA